MQNLKQTVKKIKHYKNIFINSIDKSNYVFKSLNNSYEGYKRKMEKMKNRTNTKEKRKYQK